MELSSSNIKKILILCQKKAFLCFLKRKLFLYFRKETLHFSAQARKIKEIHSVKISYNLGNGDPEKFPVFSKKKDVLTFQETET